MSFWNILNWLAWAGCAVLACAVLVDFVRTEAARNMPDREIDS